MITWSGKTFLIAKPEDINLDAVIAKVHGTCGFTYLNNFLFSADYSIMLILVLLLGFGVISCSTLYNNRKNGFGTLILQRISYKSYVHNIIIAQIMYVVTFMIVFYSLLFLFSMTIFGFGIRGQHITGSLLFTDYSIIKSIFYLLLQFILHMTFVVLSIVLSTLTERIISSSYLLMLMPFFLLILPFVIASLLGSIVPLLGQLANYFVVQNYLLSLYSYDASLGNGVEFIFIVPTVLLICILLITKKNIHDSLVTYL